MTEAGRLRVCAAALVVAATLAAAAASFNNSATNDEPFHTLAGFLYLMNVPVIPIRERSKK